MEIWLKGFQCERCGHQWKPRKEGIPKKCPHCDSSSWQRGKKMEPGERELQIVQPKLPSPVRGIPGHVLAERLKDLDWPDDKFADDLEEVLKEIRSQIPMEEPNWSRL